jgi:hypothetical protein
VSVAIDTQKLNASMEQISMCVLFIFALVFIKLFLSEMLLRCLSRISRPSIRALGLQKEATYSAWINFESRRNINIPKTDTRRCIHTDFDKTK